MTSMESCLLTQNLKGQQRSVDRRWPTEDGRQKMADRTLNTSSCMASSKVMHLRLLKTDAMPEAECNAAMSCVRKHISTDMK